MLDYVQKTTLYNAEYYFNNIKNLPKMGKEMPQKFRQKTFGALYFGTLFCYRPACDWAKYNQRLSSVGTGASIVTRSLRTG